jgi:hypothetical protein
VAAVVETLRCQLFISKGKKEPGLLYFSLESLAIAIYFAHFYVYIRVLVCAEELTEERE